MRIRKELWFGFSLMGIIILPFAPETKGKPLPEDN